MDDTLLSNNNIEKDLHLKPDQVEVDEYTEIQWTTLRDILVTLDKEGGREVKNRNHQLVA